MNFRKWFDPITTNARPSNKRTTSTAYFIACSLPLTSVHLRIPEGTATLTARENHMRLLCLLMLTLGLTIRAEAQETKPDIHGTADKVTAANVGMKASGIIGSFHVEAAKDAKYTYDK